MHTRNAKVEMPLSIGQKECEKETHQSKENNQEEVYRQQAKQLKNNKLDTTKKAKR